MNYLESTATFSPCRKFRYTLSRRWATGPMVAFVGLNPSTADEAILDPTVTRCVRRAQALGFGGMFMLNLFAYRDTDRSSLKKRIKRALPIIGDGNDQALLETAAKCGMVICCWGVDGQLLGRSKAVVELLKDFDLHALAVLGGGEPGHPLYLPYSLQPTLYLQKAGPRF